MNIESLKKIKEQLDDRSKGGGFLTQKDIKGEMIVRLLPDPPVLNGYFHQEVIKYWFAKKPIICQSTFGKKSVIQEELDMALASEDEDLIALASNADQATGVSQKKEMWMALLQLEYKLDKHNEIESVIVVDDKAKIFSCGPMLLSDMIKVMTSRIVIQNAKKSKLYGADPVNGTNIALSRTGTTKVDTKYAASVEQCMPMDAKYYIDVPNVYDLAKAHCPNPSYARAFVRQYLYGEPIPAEVQAKEDKRAADAKAALAVHTAPAKSVVDEDAEVAVPKKKKAVIEEDEDEETEEEEPATKPKKKAVVLDEEEDEPVKPVAKKKAVVLDEEDEDDAPIPAKKSAAKKPALDDEDDDDAPLPVTKKKSAIPPPPTPAKKIVAKKSLLDEIDEDDE